MFQPLGKHDIPRKAHRLLPSCFFSFCCQMTNFTARLGKLAHYTGKFSQWQCHFHFTWALKCRSHPPPMDTSCQLGSASKFHPLQSGSLATSSSVALSAAVLLLPSCLLQTFLAQLKPVFAAALHPHFQCRPVCVHSPNNWGQTLLNSYPADCNLPALCAHISPLLASSMCRPPEAPQLEATSAQHLS